MICYDEAALCVCANISHIISKERTDDEHATCLPRPEKEEAMGELVERRPIMGAARARCAVQTYRTCASHNELFHWFAHA